MSGEGGGIGTCTACNGFEHEGARCGFCGLGEDRLQSWTDLFLAVLVGFCATVLIVTAVIRRF